MDDKPLKSSNKILVQVGTTERSTGWATKPAKVGGRDGEQIVNYGRAPWQIVNADLSIAIRNPGLTKVYVLDANGMKLRNVELQSRAIGKSFTFPANALYVVLQ